MNGRTIALWVFLILGFVFLYNFFQASDPNEARSASSSTTWWIAFIVIVTIVSVVIVIRRNQKAYAINNEGIALLGQGRYIDALKKFREAEPLMKKQPLIHYNIGIVQMWLWQLHEAEGEFIKAKKKPAGGTDLKNLVLPQISLLYALMGKVGEAQRELSDAAKLNLSSHASALLAEGVLALRRNDPRTAVQHLGRQEVKQLGGTGRALADAAYVWAIEQATGEQRYLDRVTLFGEVGPERLRAFWPEFVGFVEKAKQA